MSELETLKLQTTAKQIRDETLMIINTLRRTFSLPEITALLPGEKFSQTIGIKISANNDPIYNSLLGLPGLVGANPAYLNFSDYQTALLVSTCLGTNLEIKIENVFSVWTTESIKLFCEFLADDYYPDLLRKDLQEFQ